jgi:protein-S-isoprenylcysteine O-methyltransferase Ste14
MPILNVYLLAGLLAHKVVWEYLKRTGSDKTAQSSHPGNLPLKIVKVVKVSILAGIVVQTFVPPVFPITNNPYVLTSSGILIYTAGLVLALAARFSLGKNWSDIEVGTVRTGHRIVETGVYRHIRHPIYVGDLALLVGLELALNSWLVIAALALIPIVLHKALAEERKLQRSLPGYTEYCERTRPFIGLRRSNVTATGASAR